MTSMPLLTIGAFARVVGLSPSALRHYDECGLLHPAEVDEATGYRYYTPEMERRARLVVRMRDAGMPIDRMRRVLDGTPEAARNALRAFQEEVRERTARATSNVAGVLSAIDEMVGGVAVARVGVHGPEVAAAVRQVVPAADTTAGSSLASVLLDVADGVLDVVATDRYWMAVRSLPFETPSDAARLALASSDALALADRLDTHGSVVVELGADGVQAAGVRWPGSGRPYPAHRVIVAGLDPAVARAIVSRDDLVAAVTELARAEVVLRVGAEEIQVERPEGTGAHAIGGVVAGPAMRLRFGSALLLRILSTAVGPQVELRFSAPDRAVEVHAPSQRGFLGLLMPVRDTFGDTFRDT
jgi:DNA polymerase III subunit beta